MTQSTYPRALIIEDKEIHAALTRRLLKKAGFEVVEVCASVRDGLEAAKRLLNLAFAPQLHLIVLDWLLPDPLSPSLEGITVAAELVRAMDEGEIHPAHIVVLTQNLDEERRKDALIVGCSLVVDKPMTAEKAAELFKLIAQPPVYPVSTEHRERYQRTLRFVRPALEMLYRGQESVAAFCWTRKAVKRLLHAVILQDMQRDEQAWIAAHGGLEQVKAFVRALSIPDEELHRLRCLLLDNPGEQWEWYMREMALSKTYLFNYKNKLYDMLAEALNRWDVDSKTTLAQPSAGQPFAA